MSGTGNRTLTLAGTDLNFSTSPSSQVFNLTIGEPSGGGQTTLEVNGQVAWRVSSNNTYTGGTIINAGRLRGDTAQTFGTGSVQLTSDDAQIFLFNGGVTYPNDFYIRGNGTPENGGPYGRDSF